MNFDNYYKKLGIKIKQLRCEAGLTQEKLGEKAGLSLDYIGKIEVSINKPGLKTVFKIAKALNVKVKDLFDF